LAVEVMVSFPHHDVKVFNPIVKDNEDYVDDFVMSKSLKSFCNKWDKKDNGTILIKKNIKSVKDWDTIQKNKERCLSARLSGN
jgi:hypothetical protein